ncbi:O-antigen ligase family protein [Nocardioides nanhaiensis]|uniref:O-antigen ligase-related domain-containing protein n=1 Tax=Nocardioides nanhaiensis TaxID=1476871 RepID=A0ABP8W1B2_9ACTN
MATDLPDRTTARRRADHTGSEEPLIPAEPPGPVAPGDPVSRRAVVAGSVALGVSVVLASTTGDFGVLVALLVAGAFGVIAIATGFRRFVHFFVAACLLRPLVDLTAGPRGQGVSVTEIFGIAVLAVMLLWLFTQRRLLVERVVAPLPLALLAIIAIFTLSTLGSPDLGEGLGSTLRMTAGIAVFFVVDLLLVTRRLSLRDVVQLVLAVAAIPLLYPFLGVLGVQVTHQKDGFTALKSVFYLSNNFAHFLVPLLVIGAAYVLRSQGRDRVLALAFCALVGAELILSQTRGAWLGALVGVLVVCVLLNRKLLLVGLAGVVLAGLFVPQVNTRLADLEPDSDQPYAENSLTWRLDQWARLWPAADDSPVLGSGPGTAVLLTGKEAHNDYMKMLVDTGVLGLAAYLVFVIGAIVVAWRALRRVRRLARSDPDAAAAHPWVEALFAGIFAYALAAAAAAAGENLIDNVTFLWTALPLFAAAGWALRAEPEQLTLARPTT